MRTPGSTCDIHSLDSSSSTSSIVVSTGPEEVCNIGVPILEVFTHSLLPRTWPLLEELTILQAGVELELPPHGVPFSDPTSDAVHLCSCPSRLRLDTVKGLQCLCAPDNFNAISFIYNRQEVVKPLKIHRTCQQKQS